jgi:O-methyltransferase
MEWVHVELVSKGDMECMEWLSSQAPEGCFVEVGVYQGGTAKVLYRVCEQQGRKLYLYDTFKGIPYKDPIDPHVVGDFSYTDPEYISKMLPKALVREGIFPASAVEMPPIAFVHLDVDQYRSYKESIEYLKPRMVPGGIMWFDDYGCVPGATAAVDELIGKENLTWCGNQTTSDNQVIGKAFTRF